MRSTFPDRADANRHELFFEPVGQVMDGLWDFVPGYDVAHPLFVGSGALCRADLAVHKRRPHPGSS